MPTDIKTQGVNDYYTILGLIRPHNGSLQSISKDELKTAYHKALLTHHPDKVMRTPETGSTPTDATVHSPLYSIDEIMRAYQTLAEPSLRATYNQDLLNNASNTLPVKGLAGTHLGVETLDLDDLKYDEKQVAWSKACRCGNIDGYVLTADDLEKNIDEGEIYVGCHGCSLFIKVLFGVVEGNS